MLKIAAALIKQHSLFSKDGAVCKLRRFSVSIDFDLSD